MALDTRQDRMSAMNLGCPWRGPLEDATEAGFSIGNRQAAAYLYSGISSATAIAIPSIPVASPGGGGGIDWQRGPSKKRRYREKELFDELVHTMRDLLHPPVPVVVRMETSPALVVAHDVDIEETYAKLAAIAAEHDEFQARLDEITRALSAYQETQTRLRERLVRQDEEDAILLMMEMI